jgi:hypothetical protein
MRFFADRRARPSRQSVLACLLLVTAFVIGLVSDAAAQPAPTQRWDGFFELVTGRHDMAPPTWMPPQPADAASRVSRHAVSRDGRYVVFDSDATNWGYSATALYRRDRRTGQTDLLLAGAARNASISADGQHIAFEICEPFMRPDSASICDAWALDLRTWTWSLLSGTPNGTFGSHNSGGPVLSADGRFAVFSSVASNLTGDPSERRHVVLRDRDPDGNGIYDEPGAAVLETISASLPALGDADSDTPDVSDDGRFVAFRSLAANLVAGDTNGTWDVFLRDRQAGETRRLNVGPQGEQSLVPIDEPQISMSADGRFVAFSSSDGQLAASAIDDVNDVRDVFVYDRDTLALTRIDVGRAGGAPALGNAPTGWPTLSADGRYVSVESAASNVDAPPTGTIGQAYVVDRMTGQATRISAARLGLDNDVAGSRPAISGDGSVVLFWSTATAFARFEQPPVAEQLYAAVHLAISPAEVTVPARGGEAAFTVTTQPHTLWWAVWDPSTFPWVLPAEAPQGIGSGTMRFTVDAANPVGTPRSAPITLGDATATVTQEAGLSLTSLTPASGPADGGTVVTLTGTGFEPGMMVYFGGAPAGVEYVDATTLRVTTPPKDNGQPGVVPVAIGTEDGRFAWLDWAFEYTPAPDTTPPMVMGWPAGPEGQSGWFVGDVTITWGIFDGESPITSPLCPTVVVTQDTAGTTYTCQATSAGGAAVGSVTVRRDTTPPVIAISSPRVRQLVAAGAQLPLTFTCSDPTSGVTNCGLAAPSGVLLDTSVPGWHTIATAASDAAGNMGTIDVEYAVSTAVCTAPQPGVLTWLRFENNISNILAAYNGYQLTYDQPRFVAGVSGQAALFAFNSGPFGLQNVGYLDFTTAMSVSMWIKPDSSSAGRLITRPNQFQLDRNAAGRFAWTFWGADGTPFTGTSSAAAPLSAWTHVALSYEAGDVRLYVNGRLDGTWTVNLSVLPDPSGPSDDFIIGAGTTLSQRYYGAIDELQVYDVAVPAGYVEATYLSGAAGVCPPQFTTISVPAASTTFGAGTFPAVAILRDVNGAPLAGKTLTLYHDQVRPGTPRPTTTVVTDATGTARWDAPFDVDAGWRTGLVARFDGDLQHVRSSNVGSLYVEKAMPQITWSAPAPITFGTALSSVQLNATANTPGTKSYTPSSGAVLGGGMHTLRVTFTPTQSTNYQTATATIALEVRRAPTTVTISGGPSAYNGYAQAATVSARDNRGASLPVTVTYNGASTLPTDPGVYTVVATFAGNADHEPASATGTFEIVKAVPTITFSPANGLYVTYDGQPHPITATATGAWGVTLSPVVITYNGQASAPVDAGTYTALATFEGNAYHAARTVSGTVHINKATPVIHFSGLAAVYDGSPRAATATAKTASGVTIGPADVSYGGSPNAPVDAGTYPVTATFAGTTNFTAVTRTESMIIGQAVPEITLAPQSARYPYDGQPHAVTATVTGPNGVPWPTVPVQITYNGSPTPPTEGGSYLVTATVQGTSNYTAVSRSTTLGIDKVTPSLTATGGTFVYDGQPHAATVTSTGVPGQAPPGALTVTYNGSPDPPVQAGLYLVEAQTAPTPNYQPSFTQASLIISKAVPVVTIVAGTFTFDGQPHAATASVTGVGGSSLGPVTITYNGGTAVPTNAGTYEVSASFAGDTNYAPASGSATITIGKATTTLSWNAPAAIGYGTPLGAGQLNATANLPGTFVYSPAGGIVLGAGAGRPLAATFTPADSANYIGGTVSTTIDVVPAPLVVRTHDAAKIYGAPVPGFTAAFTGLVNGDTPASLAGALAFATAATSSSPVGTYGVTPAGLSSPNYTIGFVAGTLSVLKAPVAMTLTASPTPSGVDMPITFTATVAAAQTAPTAPAGTVRFFDGATLLGTATLSGNTAVLMTGGLGVGSHTVEARYDGDTSFDAGSRTATHVVNAAAATPAITLTTSRQPASTTQSMTFTATITVATAGTIAFYDGATLLGSGSIVSGRATLAVGSLAAGSHAITARFQGNATAPPVISAVLVQSVTAGGWRDRTSTMNLASSANPSTLGSGVTFTATVSGSSGTPAGRILFMVDGLVVGDPAGVPVTTVNASSSRATVTVPSLNGGRHKVTATYLGSSNYRGSNGALTQTVN